MLTFTISGNGIADPIAVVGLAAGEHWFNDEAADDYQPNDFGGCDSVLDLTSP